MTFKRKGEKLLTPKLPKNPIFWVFFLMEQIGRLTYKGCFLVLKTALLALDKITKSALKVFYKARLVSQKLSLFSNKLVQSIKSVKAAVKYRLWLIGQEKRKKEALLAKKTRFKISLPKLRIPRVQIPKIPVPRIAFPKVPAIAFSCLAFLLLTFYFLILKDLPSPNRLTTKEQVVSTKIYDRSGQLLYTLYNGNQNRTLISLNGVPEYLKEATIAIEDKDFYYHQGFSIRGIIRAIQRNVFKHSIEGGSTITQQLVKNALLSPEKTLIRKVKEFVLALEVELLFTKDEILQMYFNEIPYGGTAYGAEAAAKTYFGKSAKDLTLAEAALLAGLPAAPTRFSPFGANPQLAFERQEQVLQRMIEEKYITEEEREQALKQKIVFAPQRTDIKAPHFVMYVKDLLVKKYGQRIVEEGGLEVITSLDLETQKMAEEMVKQEVGKLEKLHVTNGAALVTDPETGEILAMVGSKDYFDAVNDGNVNVTTRLRQPGSTIKVVNYTVALQNGYTAASIISDTPVAYQISGSPIYAPVNYDNRFHGNVTLRTALACSYNVPAVKVLASYGIGKMVQMGQDMGITTWEDSSRFGLSLTLGGGEVKMTDLAVVYGTLANMGKKVELQSILKVVDYKGKVLENYYSFDEDPKNGVQAKEEQTGKQVISPEIAYVLSDVLSDNKARTPAFGPRSDLVIPNNQVAVKTGTTNDKRDNWTIGYTSDYLVAVWVGNNDNSPMSAVASGVTGASPIWNNIMKNLLADKLSHQFSKPQELKAVEVCSLNGLLPCEGCPTKVEYFIPGTEPKVHCVMKKEKEEEEKKEEDKKKDKLLEGISTGEE